MAKTTAVDAPATPQAGQCLRELYWHERSAEQKIERLAEAVEYLASKAKEQHEASQILRIHSHSADGKVQVPLDAHLNDPAAYFFRNPLGRENRG